MKYSRKVINLKGGFVKCSMTKGNILIINACIQYNWDWEHISGHGRFQKAFNLVLLYCL